MYQAALFATASKKIQTKYVKKQSSKNTGHILK